MIILLSSGVCPPSVEWVWWPIWNYSVFHRWLGGRLSDASCRHTFGHRRGDVALHLIFGTSLCSRQISTWTGWMKKTAQDWFTEENWSSFDFSSLSTRLCSSNGNFISRWLWEYAIVPRSTASSRSRPRLRLPPQTHHCDGDGLSHVCCRRYSSPAPVLGGDWSAPLCGLDLPLFRADVCGDGAGVGTHIEREAKAETDQPRCLKRRWKILDIVKYKMLFFSVWM